MKVNANSEQSLRRLHGIAVCVLGAGMILTLASSLMRGNSHGLVLEADVVWVFSIICLAAYGILQLTISYLGFGEDLQRRMFIRLVAIAFPVGAIVGYFGLSSLHLTPTDWPNFLLSSILGLLAAHTAQMVFVRR